MADTPHLVDMEIQALLDGGLAGSAARAARSHLATCARCARRLEAQARLFAEIESWEEAAPPHDLEPRVLAALRPPSTPIGLRWAAALQAGLVLLIVALAWPVVTSLAQSLNLPSLWVPTTSTVEAWLAETSAFTAALEASLQALPGSAAAWLRLAPNWIAIWPAIVAGAGLAAVVGNSILLSGNATSSRAARARRL
jgi:anti-sigma factor RsiW